MTTHTESQCGEIQSGGEIGKRHQCGIKCMLCQANDVIGHILLRVHTANTGSNPALTTMGLVQLPAEG